MSDGNPHYLTPEEAEEKWCVQYMRDWATCSGPKCMAWRWRIRFDYDDEGRGHQKISTTHGQCGIVRQ